MPGVVLQKTRGPRRVLRHWWWVAYLALLAASHAMTRGPSEFSPDQIPAGVESISIPAQDDDGPVPGRTIRLAWRQWIGQGRVRPIPVILLHGSPGSGGGFAPLAGRLTRLGYRCIAFDLPGFGFSTHDIPRYSILAHARDVLAGMDAMGLERAHVVAWSQGGGVGLNMADLAPDRVASLTLMASIGAQESEGSGSFAFEHAKYAIGWAGLVVGGEAVPHFGLLGPHWFRRSFIRNFWDSDQRPLASIMRRLRMPVLILHGRRDPLVPAWGAELHHRLIPTSRLVMLDASHFLPFEPLDQTTAHLGAFLRRHDDPDAAPIVGYTNLAPVEQMPIAWRAAWTIGWWIRHLPLLGTILAVALLAALFEDATIVLVGALVSFVEVDFGVAFAGIVLGGLIEAGGLWMLGRRFGQEARRLPLIGRFVPRICEIDWRRRLGREPGRVARGGRFLRGFNEASWFAAGLIGLRRPRFVLWGFAALALKVLLGLVLLMILAKALLVPMGDALGWIGLILGLVVLLVAWRALLLTLTWTGRQIIKAKLTRLVRHEFWPTWVFYLPLVPWIMWLGIRHRGLLVFTCVNPGIEHGGGIAGESKAEIQNALPDDAGVLRAIRIDAGDPPGERARRAIDLIRTSTDLGGYPAILKPDVGERGLEVRLVRTDEDVIAYMQRVRRAIVVQRYHPGPCECGVFWMRRPKCVDDAGTHAENDRAGFIYSITRKGFPAITGDGRRTLEQLVRRHRRYRCQARVFKARFAGDWSRVLDEGEVVRLAQSGNHAQGTLFRDGADLVTPELEARIDAIARSFAGVGGRGLDFGRFDLRYESDDLLRRGLGLAIIELNGTTSESTNLYDPRRSIFWAQGVLLRQWAHLYRLGAARRDAGSTPMRFAQLLAMVLVHRRQTRRGAVVSD